MNKKIKVYGERNTNTNYIYHLINLNLDVHQIPGTTPNWINRIQGKVNTIFPRNEMLMDIYFYLTYKKNLGWKHTCVESVEKLKRYSLVDENLIFLTLTKNPYAWLLSLYRRPYNRQFYYNKPNSFERFLQEPWQTVGSDNCNRIIKNPIQLWNIKNRSYLQLKNLNVLNIKTEDIFLDPEKIIEQISQQFSIRRISDTFIEYQSPIKKADRGTNKNSQYYRDYYLNEKWRDRLTNNAIVTINKSIDISLMSYFGYSLLS